MHTQTSAKIEEILNEAQRSIRDLITESAGANHYDDVVELAELAKRLAALASGHRPTVERVNGADTEGPNTSSPTISSRSSSRSRTPSARGKKAAATYPIFYTTDEKLVKVGWSKKNKSEYEHRAPKTSMATAFAAIQTAAGTTSHFEVESLMPLAREDGEELPSYQIYMAIGWLIGIGQLEKSGRNAYSKSSEALLEFEECWSMSEKEDMTDG